jgi:hypothetical protein
MENLIDYQTFSDLNEASDLIELLNINQIPFEIDDSALHFDVVLQNMNPMDNGVIIKISPRDKERADKVFLKNTENDSIDDHYLFSFSDNDIIDIIVNPEEWTEEEIALAKKILKQRELKPTIEQVKSLRKNTNKVKEQIKKENSIIGGAGLFFVIGFYSIINTFTNIFSEKQYYSGGLGINKVIMSVISGVQQATGNNYFELGITLTFILPVLFFWVGSKSKKKIPKVYLTGMILFGIDTLLLILYKSWFNIALHLMLLIMIFDGYRKLIARKKRSELEGIENIIESKNEI